MSERRTILVGATAVVVVAVLLGAFLTISQPVDCLSPSSGQGIGTGLSMGITYLPVTRGLSAYYELGVDYGALVTEVMANSPASSAGVKVGDVILSFNEVRLNQGMSLLGMMRACPSGSRIALEVWDGNGVRAVEFVHIEK